MYLIKSRDKEICGKFISIDLILNYLIEFPNKKALILFSINQFNAERIEQSLLIKLNNDKAKVCNVLANMEFQQCQFQQKWDLIHKNLIKKEVNGKFSIIYIDSLVFLFNDFKERKVVKADINILLKELCNTAMQ